ncbi:cytochrome c [Aliidongia dinghuensis]|uniref:Cytochrome c1 n=1 Tax=Aliidongia dinghuensis TaxID=1867774 RepID=A0A8J2YQR6_9PROT|nr:cytochrome c1 [Aliidongia dinghuensis]GGF08408.1 cytochrome c [Aliidongia dinghuensis]
MIRRFLLGAAIAVSALATQPLVAHAQEAAEPELLKGDWSFSGIFGTIDKASAQRGLQIYKEVCSNCHGLYEMSYRNIAALGYSDDQVKAFAAQYQVNDTNDDGAVIQRPAKPSDRFVRPFPNEKAARAANNGANPPDLALIVKSREGGVNYVYSILQGYKQAPADVKLADGQYYNIYFTAGGQKIGMPQPLTDGAVTFANGAPNDLKSEAHDVATFLAWAAEPEQDARKRLGVRVMLFLIVLTGALYYAKRKIWADLH